MDLADQIIDVEQKWEFVLGIGTVRSRLELQPGCDHVAKSFESRDVYRVEVGRCGHHESRILASQRS